MGGFGALDTRCGESEILRSLDVNGTREMSSGLPKEGMLRKNRIRLQMFGVCWGKCKMFSVVKERNGKIRCCVVLRWMGQAGGERSENRACGES